MGYLSGLPQPRFFTQGSWAYKTLNAPATCPPQQADLDDGCYLPLSFVQEVQRPRVAAGVFFSVAENALKPLVAQNKWKLDTSKATCIRIVISSSAHIDIPLYAIPDDEFEKLLSRRLVLDKSISSSQTDQWSALPSDKVLLAHREKDWMPSDPRQLKDWFLAEVAAKGEQFRRVVRYLKAFRDWQWDSSGPSSVLLMAAAAPLFKKYDGRDDRAFQHVVNHLPARLRDGVLNPTDKTESFTGRLGEKGVEEAAKAFEGLRETIRAARDTHPPVACALMRKKFGSRFPDEPERVKRDTELPNDDDALSHVLPIPWPHFKNIGRISISVTQHKSEEGDCLGPYQSDGIKLPTDIWLNFKAEHTFRDGIVIHWQVVNTGQEARDANNLRGGFDTRGSEIWETTRYTGKHWVECFAVDSKRNISLARSGKFYVNIA
jgi:hypothetical protein